MEIMKPSTKKIRKKEGDLHFGINKTIIHYYDIYIIFMLLNSLFKIFLKKKGRTSR